MDYYMESSESQLDHDDSDSQIIKQEYIHVDHGLNNYRNTIGFMIRKYMKYKLGLKTNRIYVLSIQNRKYKIIVSIYKRK